MAPDWAGDEEREVSGILEVSVRGEEQMKSGQNLIEPAAEKEQITDGKLKLRN